MVAFCLFLMFMLWFVSVFLMFMLLFVSVFLIDLFYFLSLLCLFLHGDDVLCCFFSCPMSSVCFPCFSPNAFPVWFGLVPCIF